MRSKNIFIATLIVLSSINFLSAQEAISIFGRVYADKENGPGYFQPLSNILNQSLSMQWQSHRPQSRIRLGLSLIATRSFVPKEYETFQASYTSDLDGQIKFVTAPTLVGENEAVVVTESNGYSHVFPGGLQYQFVTIAQPQLTVEGILNSAASLRFLTFNIDDEVGRFSNFGLSFLHHFAPYFNIDSSVVINASAGYERLSAGEIWSADHSFIQVTGGQYGKYFNFYAGLGMQWFTQSVSYEEPFENFERQKINIPANNQFLLKLGIGYQVSIFSAGIEIAPLAPFTLALNVGLKI